MKIRILLLDFGLDPACWFILRIFRSVLTK